MLEPVELSLFPSCSDSLSWSADGELAVAAGEFVHVLTPKRNQAGDTLHASKSVEVGWHVTRFRVNAFTNKEWPTIFPQKRDDFSIGAEQSVSTVVGLAWSPPGLGKYRRCLLAVQTSNMLLSLYEALGPQSRWTRVAIVNHSLREHFGTLTDDAGPLLRKTSIRSFAWCPSCKLPTPEQQQQQQPTRRPTEQESRWGMQILCIANDENDLIFLHVQRSKINSSPATYQYTIHPLSLTSVYGHEGNYPMVQSGSLLSAAIRERIKIKSISCGPWHSHSHSHLHKSKGAHTATACVAVVYGTKLKFVRLEITLPQAKEGPETIPGYTPELHSIEYEFKNTHRSLAGHQFTGPVQWVAAMENQVVHLAVGIFAGIVTISMPNIIYEGKPGRKADCTTWHKVFYENEDDPDREDHKHWDPIGGMTAVASDDMKAVIVHLGTQAGYVSTITLTESPETPTTAAPHWKKQFEDFKERFDIDRDLGGLAIARIWGLASHHGIVAAALTLHPGDMIEYRIGAEERTMIVFSDGNVSEEAALSEPTLLMPEIDRSPVFLRCRREIILDVALNHEADDLSSNAWSQKLLYAAACCAIVESHDDRVRSRAKAAFEKLATISGVDLKDEISGCSSETSTINSKPAEVLFSSGAEFIEKCDICEEGLSWYSPQEAQCASGHLFVRCAFTFLAIQEPDLSKFCSNCDTEYLNEDLLTERINADLGDLFHLLSQAFDTCAYCDGKFRD